MKSICIYIYIFLYGRNAVADETPGILEELLKRVNTLENKVSDQETVIAEQSTKILKQTTLLRQFEMKLLQSDNANSIYDGKTKAEASLKRFVMDEGAVAFTAAIAPIVVNHVKDKETIKFETMITSIGGGYNNLTGVFVAPVSGIYVFSCSLLDHNGDHMAPNGAMVHAEIVHNQKILGRVFAHATQSYRDQGAQTVFAQVNQGDQVWVRNFENPDLGLGGELYSTFSGYLLQAI